MTQSGARLRDRFFALHASGTDLDKQTFRAEVDTLAGEPTTRVQGLSLAYHPSARFKQLRFLDAALLDAEVRSLFARPCAELPELAAAFVDPQELCFRSFENIICLDRLFPPIEDEALRLGKPKRVGKGIFQLSTTVNAAVRTQLERLDQLDLYVRPLNAASRGGQRFIFHCAALAEALTVALRRALPKALPKALLGQFSHVNPVFRCNRFEPGDERFFAHVDSPYHDRSRNHVSKYTLLLYLTGGRGDAVLEFGDERMNNQNNQIDEIEAMTAFVFDQRLVHSGGPYLDGRKLFLRTELVFEDANVEHDPGIGGLFAKACYLTGESVFAPELARFAHEAYDRAAAAHWRGLVESAAPTPFMHKQFRGVHFVANGYDYWFRKGDVSLIECAALALFDVLNVKLRGTSFHKLCSSEVVIRTSDDRAWMGDCLHGFAPPTEPAFARANKPALFPEPEPPSKYMNFPNSPDFDPEPFPDDWDATRHPKVITEYVAAQHEAKQRILPAPITMLGRELFLDPERFVVDGDKIHVLSRDALAPLHFAGAVFYGPADFVDVDVTLGALRLLVPPILFRETDDVVHLQLDLFRNSWMVRHRFESAPVPRIVDGRDVDPDTSPWDRAMTSLREPGSG
jgi:hypothetical protein